MKIDPERYVVRVPGGWAVLPFDENVTLEGADAKTAQAVMEEVARFDISLVCDAKEWEVRWMHGGELSEEMLLECT